MAGKIVPVKITVNLIKDAMMRMGWASKRFLIDGFPRNEDNYQGWNEVMSEISTVKKVLWYECDEDTLIKRALQRAEISKVVRSDDNIETLKKRIC